MFMLELPLFTISIGIFNDFENNNNGITLKLDTNWWLNEFKNVIGNGNAIYCDTIDSVCEEINESKLKFNPTMELLYQSKSHPILKLKIMKLIIVRLTMF